MNDAFGARSVLQVGDRRYEIFRLEALSRAGIPVERLPFSMRILLENLLRSMDGRVVTAGDVEAVGRWDPMATPSREIAFSPSRVLLQDFTGVPAVVDLAAMRDAMEKLGGSAAKINPLQPAELVIDHSVQVDEYGSRQALLVNATKEFERNRERYLFLRWGQRAFQNFRVVPPATGIVHQVNLEFLARVVFTGAGDPPQAYPDTLIGTDSHTTMINGLGVLGWGVGGIEAEAAMLGQPVSMLLPQVVGFRMTGALPEGSTATDLVLTVTETLRKKGVVGRFVEFYGPGLAALPVADRATIANMSPEYGATCGMFPIDAETLRYLEFTGRPPEQVRLIEAYTKEQGLFHDSKTPEAAYSDTLSLDLGTVEPSLAGPRRPQDRVRLRDAKKNFAEALPTMRAAKAATATPPRPLERWEGEGGDGAAGHATATLPHVTMGGESFPLSDGAVVIAAITSCTNTSNPSVMVGAGLVAKRAVERGLKTKPWVKTSLAPGSKAVTEYLARAGLTPHLESLGFFTVGYGCTTCIGNSGPLPPPISKAIEDEDLVVAAVLSGNRNFEGRIHPEVRANYLASPPLVVAYALAGRMDLDLTTEPLGTGSDGAPVFLRDLWPTQIEIDRTVHAALQSETFRETYRDVYTGDPAWRNLPVPEGDRYAWDPSSTYVKRPPYFDDMPATPPPVPDVRDARVLALLGDSVTTDHISPAGTIKKDSPAGRYLIERGVAPLDFNSYGSRRGNHEVMVRGTFANTRIRNKMVPGVEGGFTTHLPDGATMPIYDAAMRYEQEGVPTLVIAGKEYGSGSSRDWAAKGPKLLGVRAVLAESFERIHRSNLIGMGILPLQFPAGQTAESLGLTGREIFAIEGIAAAARPDENRAREVTVRADGKSFRALVRLDTPQEVRYYQNGGILTFVLRRLLRGDGVVSRFRFSWIEFIRSADLQMGLTAACAVFGLAGAGMRLFHGASPDVARILYVLAYLTGGFGPTRDLVRNIRLGQLDINLLMVVAALGSAFIGHWGEGAALLFLFSLSGALERYTMERTARSIESLIELRPDSAIVLRDGAEVRVRVEEIRVGERVLSIPGERFAVDGVIVEGETSADESTITGEAEPVDKAAGDTIYAGTVNLTGAPIVRVTKMPEETTLSRIVRAVQEARRDKSTTERVVERWQKRYVISVFAGSALATAFMMAFFNHSFIEAFYHGMILLVAASPCAVVIATPAAMLSAITHAAHHGVLFKGSAHLERLGDVTAIAFDKTGTITEGRPRVVAVMPEDPPAAADELIRLGAAVEARSEHHTAKAVVAEAVRRKLAVPHATEFESHSGLGTHGRVEGLWVGVGREALFRSHEVAIPNRALGEAEQLRSGGQSALLVVARRGSVDGPGSENGLVASGAVGVADTLRPEAKAALRACRAMGIRHIAIFTGDHARVALPVADEVGADELKADLLPEQKVAAVRELMQRWPNLAMVGDGVNDAPALATAPVGIAMGGAGTDVALDTADVVLMRDDLRGIAFSIWLARRARRVVSQSLSIAFGVIGVLILSTVAGILPLWLAVVCHEGSTLVVIANGVRLLGMPHPEFEIA